MKKLLMVISLVFLLCFTFSCQKQAEEEKPAVDITADIKALKDINDESLVKAYAGEFDRLVSFYYAEDAVLMPPNQPILEGREAELARIKRANEKYDFYNYSSIVEDVRVFGDMAMVRGNDTGTITLNGGGEPTKFDSKWLGIFERQPDGTWKCICEIWNSNLPLPESAEKE